MKTHGAQPETINAWTELLSVVSKALIENETKQYTENEQYIGGWNGVREFTIKKVEDLGAGLLSFYAYPADGKAIATFSGGQYVTIKAELPGHGEQYRHVPLCNTPNKHPYYRLTTSVGTEIGAYLQSKKEGDSIELLSPSGNFTL